MTMALSAAQMSHCTLYKVGCIIVKERRPLVIGINGTPRGQINCDEHFGDIPIIGADDYPGWRKSHSEWSQNHENHAEANAIGWAARNGIVLDGSILYGTLSPCTPCAKVAEAAGIQKWIYLEEYDRFRESFDYLNTAKIKTEKMFLGDVGAVLERNQDLLEEIRCREQSNEEGTQFI
jgi:dCMP deaminase